MLRQGWCSDKGRGIRVSINTSGLTHHLIPRHTQAHSQLDAVNHHVSFMEDSDAIVLWWTKPGCGPAAYNHFPRTGAAPPAASPLRGLYGRCGSLTHGLSGFFSPTPGGGGCLVPEFGAQCLLALGRHPWHKVVSLGFQCLPTNPSCPWKWPFYMQPVILGCLTGKVLYESA